MALNRNFDSMKHPVLSTNIFLAIAMMTYFQSCSPSNQQVSGENQANTVSSESATNDQLSHMSLHQFSAVDINGRIYDFSQLKGKKVIIVNTASECGYTYQYKGLQELYETKSGGNLEIIGFPCNDFGAQEPGTESEIAGFCEKNYGVTFPMMSKITVKGDSIHPVFNWLVSADNNGVGDFPVKWNFQKYLINEDGSLEACYESGVEPSDQRILNWLNK
jgi:glutathione peroxidase